MKILCLLSSLLLFYSQTIAQYTAKVQHAIQQTHNNQKELIKALDYFYKSKDALKIKSINFLIENLPIHSTYSYYWSDKSGKRVPFNELEYPTFNDAVNAFNKLREKYDDLHPVAFSYRDIDSISSDYLISTVEKACSVWKANKYISKNSDLHFSENEFLEYVLPYRIDVEEPTNWRNVYHKKFETTFSGRFTVDSILLRNQVNQNFKNLWGIESRKEPLPRLNALQILLRGKGYCEDMANMAVFAARSHGIPATVDNIPAWATSYGNHTCNYINFDGKHRHFDSALDSLVREPGKVLRTTYSLQHETLAAWLDTSQIPPGFLRLKNYKDVTHEYWKTGNFSISLTTNTISKAVFVGVLNGGNIIPIWYAKKNGRSATFTNMSKGVVYFPFYYHNNSSTPASYPIAFGYHNVSELKPDFNSKRTIVVKDQEQYLKYRTGKRYQLLVWDNQWKILDEKVAPQGCTYLTFENVPRNALFLLRPEYSLGKERPFTILENGDRVWW